ncbi:MAG: hypothetical protein COA43_01150 [Robiginitomaculum sp.]|nr:MAG: hypothetical protein COA43_01150 [Robiginitomaculum sp.]
MDIETQIKAQEQKIARTESSTAKLKTEIEHDQINVALCTSTLNMTDLKRPSAEQLKTTLSSITLLTHFAAKHGALS